MTGINLDIKPILRIANGVKATVTINGKRYDIEIDIKEGTHAVRDE